MVLKQIFEMELGYNRTKTSTLIECQPPSRHVKISKWENMTIFVSRYGDSDQSQNLMGYKLDQDPSSGFLMNFQRVVFA